MPRRNKQGASWPGHGDKYKLRKARNVIRRYQAGRPDGAAKREVWRARYERACTLLVEAALLKP